MSDDVLHRYIELRKQLFRIEEELEALKPDVTAQLRQRDGVVRFEGYTLALNAYTAWAYSPRVESLQRTLNDTKKQERQDGTATVKERRDMLVLKAQRAADHAQAREEPAPYGEWEPDSV